MTRTEYDAWATNYRETFGLSSDADLLMLDAWFEHFEAIGYTVDDLRQATRAVLVKPPKFRTEHLPAIQSVIGDRRRAAMARRWSESADDQRGECVECGDVGWVVVPHPKYASAGDWLGHHLFGYRPTSAVTCSCWKGRMVAESVAKKEVKQGSPLSLEAYARLVPGWKTLMNRREREVLTGHKARDAAVRAEQVIGRLAEETRAR